MMSALTGTQGTPAPDSLWRRVFADGLRVGGTGFICQGIGVVTSLALRAALDPAAAGIWQTLKSVLSYGNYANLGASKGAARELSQAVGRGDPDSVAQSLHAAHTLNVIGSCIYAVMLCGIAAFVVWRQPGQYAIWWTCGLIGVAGLSLLQRHVTFLVTLLRAQMQFALTSRLALWEAAGTLMIVVPMTYAAGLAGLCLGTAVLLVISWLWLRSRGAPKLMWKWDPSNHRRLVATGGPILISGLAASLVRTCDRWAILAVSTDPEFTLGCYSAALLVAGQVFGLANLFGIVLGPRFAETYGRTRRQEDVSLIAARSMELPLAGLALIATLACLCGGPILCLMLPAYEQGLTVLPLLLPSILAQLIALPAQQALVALERERRSAVINCVCAVLTAAAVAGTLHFGGGLAGVALAMSGAHVVYAAWLIAEAVWPGLSRPQRSAYLRALAAGSALPAMLFVATSTGVLQPLEPTAALVAAGFAVCLGGAAWVWIWRHGGWSRLLAREVAL